MDNKPTRMNTKEDARREGRQAKCRDKRSLSRSEHLQALWLPVHGDGGSVHTGDY